MNKKCANRLSSSEIENRANASNISNVIETRSRNRRDLQVIGYIQHTLADGRHMPRGVRQQSAIRVSYCERCYGKTVNMHSQKHASCYYKVNCQTTA